MFYRQLKTWLPIALLMMVFGCRHAGNSAGQSVDQSYNQSSEKKIQTAGSTIHFPTDFGLQPIEKDKWGSDPFVKDGSETTRHPNGLLKTQGNYKKGLRDGPWYSWYPSGHPWSETSFENGLKTGPTKTWFSNGKLRYDGFYAKDKPTGHWKFYDETGKLVQEKQYK